MLPRSSAPWFDSTRQYAAGPPVTTTSGTNHTSAPAANAPSTRNQEPRPTLLRANPESRIPHPEAISSGTVSHTTCERMPVATPAHKPARARAGTVRALSVNA